MKPTPITLILLCANMCGCAGGVSQASDQANIQGVWLAHSESQNGHTKDVTYQYAFTGDTVTFTDETGKEMKYLFKLDTANNPKLLTIWPAETLTSSSPVSVAYALDGDSLTIVIAPPGLRPTELSDKNDQELIVCTRSTRSRNP